MRDGDFYYISLLFLGCFLILAKRVNQGYNNFEKKLNNIECKIDSLNQSLNYYE
jgi:hypothetical protein